jgi:hypothetical protein
MVLPAGPVRVVPGVGVIIWIRGVAPNPPTAELESEMVRMKLTLLDGLEAVIVDCRKDMPTEPLVVARKPVWAKPLPFVTLVMFTSVPLLAGEDDHVMATPATGLPEAPVA